MVGLIHGWWLKEFSSNSTCNVGSRLIRSIDGPCTSSHYLVSAFWQGPTCLCVYCVRCSGLGLTIEPSSLDFLPVWNRLHIIIWTTNFYVDEFNFLSNFIIFKMIKYRQILILKCMSYYLFIFLIGEHKYLYF